MPPDNQVVTVTYHDVFAEVKLESRQAFRRAGEWIDVLSGRVLRERLPVMKVFYVQTS